MAGGMPVECWEAIFDLIRNPQDHHLESLSLVCKSFLSSSNRIRSTLNISDRTLLLAPDGDVSPLFRRFHQLKRISFVGFHGDLESVVERLSRSDLRLEALDLSGQEKFPSNIKELGLKLNGTMKALICANMNSLCDVDLVEMALALPELEEVDISYPNQERSRTISDRGIESLSMELPKLRSINLSGNDFITDHSVMHLSKNCLLLSRISAKDCCLITGGGVDHVIRNCSNLSSLSVNEHIVYYHSPHADHLHLLHLSPATSLQSLDLSRIHLRSDNELMLFVTGIAKLRLRKLVLSNCKGFTFAGISTLLGRCNALEHLDLEGMDFLTDEMISYLFKHLRCLISVGLNLCTCLTSLTFFNLVKNCPLLEEIRMQWTSLGKEDSVSNIRKNCSNILSLKLASNMYLCDETLERIGIVCSELKLLDVGQCGNITGMGIGIIGKCCADITELRIDGCVRVRNLGSDSEFSNLDVLVASASGIGYEGLGMIGRGCPRLRVLDLSGCVGVTDEGLKELVRTDGCRNFLRRLNLKNCCNVSAVCLAWMVFLGTSLRTIVSPCNPFPNYRTMKHRDLFLRHGCLVTSGQKFH